MTVLFYLSAHRCTVAERGLCYNRLMQRLRRQTRHAVGVAVVLSALGALPAGCGPTPMGTPQATATTLGAPRVALGAGARTVGLIVEPDDGVRVIMRPIRRRQQVGIMKIHRTRALARHSRR
jgi:hypothetical protein